MSAKVADVMTRSVIAVRRNASFKELAVKLRDERISAFPVIDDDDRVIGVVSEADLIANEEAREPFVARAREAGAALPIVPGIMPGRIEQETTTIT